MITNDDIELGLRLDAERTQGEWKVERRYSNECEIIPRITCAPDADRGYGWIADMIGAPYLGHETTLPNAAFIAHTSKHYADALREVKRLREALKEIQITNLCGGDCRRIARKALEGGR